MWVAKMLSSHESCSLIILLPEVKHYHQQYLFKVPNGYCGVGGTGVACPVGLTSGDAREAMLGRGAAILYRNMYSRCMTVLHDPTELTVTEAAQRGVARLVADAEQGTDLVVTRRHQPVAAVVSIRRLHELEEAAADLRDLALVLARSVTDTGERVSLDEVLAAFGHTRESLAVIPDDE